jgi:hypothetical protein
MSHAAQHGLVYHLWWHPENFGADTDENLAFLRKVLRHYRGLAECGRMRSLGMAEVAEVVRSAS